MTSKVNIISNEETDSNNTDKLILQEYFSLKDESSQFKSYNDINDPKCRYLRCKKKKIGTC